MEFLSTLFLQGMIYYTNSLILLSFLFGAVGLSTYYYNRKRGSNPADSANAAMMMIFLITGFIMFYAGSYFVTNPDKLLTQNLPDLLSNGWGLIGFGFSIIVFSISYIGNIETQRNIEQIKIFLFRGRHFTREYKPILNSRELLNIAIIWWAFAVLTWIYCILYQPAFIFYPIIVDYFMLSVAVIATLFSACRNSFFKQKFKKKSINILKWIRKKIIVFCIFCYLFPEKYPEFFE